MSDEFERFIGEARKKMYENRVKASEECEYPKGINSDARDKEWRWRDGEHTNFVCPLCNGDGGFDNDSIPDRLWNSIHDLISFPDPEPDVSDPLFSHEWDAWQYRRLLKTSILKQMTLISQGEE